MADFRPFASLEYSLESVVLSSVSPWRTSRTKERLGSKGAPPRPDAPSAADLADNGDMAQDFYGFGNTPAWRTPATVSLMVLASVVMATTLRPAATSVGPILEELTVALSLTPTAAGLLTALPGFCFALVGLTANRFTSLTGPTGALVSAAALTAAGMVLRVLTDSWQVFVVFSFLTLAGAAIGNVVLPAYIKAEFPRRAAPMATAYTTALALGSTVPIFTSTAILRRAEQFWPGEGWRFALGFWAGPAALSLVLWLFLYVRVPHFRSRQRGGPRRAGLWTLFRSRTAVALMFFFGLQSMHAYIQFGWLPSAYRAGGLGADAAAWMGTIVAVGGIPGGLLMPTVVPKRRFLRPAIGLFGVLLAIGYVGIAFAATTVPWVWAVCLAIAGFCFPTALALIIERTKDPAVTAAVSGFVQPVGYLLAGAGPFLVGAGFGLTGSWPPILLVLAGTSILLVSAGWVASGKRYIDDELGRS